MRRSGLRLNATRLLMMTPLTPPVLTREHPGHVMSVHAKGSEATNTGKFERPAPWFTASMTGAMTSRRASAMSDTKSTNVYESHDMIDVEQGKGGIEAFDGCQAVAHAAYALSDTVFIFPITPATAMGEVCDAKAAAGVLNCFGSKVTVTEMQSEGGVAGALHGAVSTGALATSFTSSQGMLLMIPLMYKIAGQLFPCVIHVASRGVAVHNLGIFCDHGDVMATRQTGWTMLCSENQQMAHDFALLSHLTTIASSVPVLHFFDGFLTSHEVSKVELSSYEEIKKLIPQDALKSFRMQSLTPTRPYLRGACASNDVFMQGAEAANPIRARVFDTLSYYSEELYKVLHRRYSFYAYEGAADAEHVIVIMGTGSSVTHLAVTKLVAQGHKVGVIKVRLFRPWVAEAFLASLPQTVKTVTVLDRCVEPGASGEPLFLEVNSTIQEHRPGVTMLAGRYGIGGKDYTPGMAITVFQNSMSATPKRKFTVGVIDDVSNLSLPLPEAEPDVLPPGTTQCLIYGLGSDGTVMANKVAVKIINKSTDQYATAFFSYDAKKSGSLTISHLRFGPKMINANFPVQQADYVAVHRSNYIDKYDVLKHLKEGGTVVINCPWTPEDADQHLPSNFRRTLALKKARLVFVNAAKVAAVTGLGKTINMIMQAVFFKLMNVIPYEKAKTLLIGDMEKSLSKKDHQVIVNNTAGIELAEKSMTDCPIPAAWAELPFIPASRPPQYPTTPQPHSEMRERYMRTMEAVVKLEGDTIPVSAFAPGGLVPTGTSFADKRGSALNIPQVDMKKCIQCNKCSLICPHAAIRPFLMTPEECESAPEVVRTSALPAQGQTLSKYKFRVQVSPLDCTGCELCSRMCPTGALKMSDAVKAIEEERPNWDYVVQLPNRGKEIDLTTIRGSQFQQPLLEFSGACEGCGETPYVKLLTQLFGSRLVIANASGCSIVWAGWTPSMAYTVDGEWGRPSLGHVPLRGQRKSTVWACARPTSTAASSSSTQSRRA